MIANLSNTLNNFLYSMEYLAIWRDEVWFFFWIGDTYAVEIVRGADYDPSEVVYRADRGYWELSIS
ncbi:hypothetical protein [Paenibacillus kribbensis]|uniref:hypothetical protein n=1 Tax=Paenibacillus kribbensis TaxID=172713 RepID=UPI0015BC0EBC|nr:hypothetical protein [Paenibacillus kribbensis]